VALSLQVSALGFSRLHFTGGPVHGGGREVAQEQHAEDRGRGIADAGLEIGEFFLGRVVRLGCLRFFVAVAGWVPASCWVMWLGPIVTRGAHAEDLILLEKT
jgi:hypothetical protein